MSKQEEDVRKSLIVIGAIGLFFGVMQIYPLGQMGYFRFLIGLAIVIILIIHVVTENRQNKP